RQRALIAELEAEEWRHLRERREAARVKSERVKHTILIGFGSSLAILSLAFLFLRRELLRRIQSEAALTEREQRLSIILNSISDGVIATDAAARVTHLNPIAEQLTGWTLAEAAGKPFAEVFHTIDERTGAAQPAAIARVLAERITISLGNHTVLVA